MIISTYDVTMNQLNLLEASTDSILTPLVSEMFESMGV